jgi:DnaJ-class molecular chaperone
MIYHFTNQNPSLILISCHSNNQDEVRDQWERCKLAYEILSDNRIRKKYDRHEVIADPSSAFKRAAMDATGNAIKGVGTGMFNVGKGLFELGAKAVADRNSNGLDPEQEQPKA